MRLYLTGHTGWAASYVREDNGSLTVGHRAAATRQLTSPENIDTPLEVPHGIRAAPATLRVQRT